MDPDKISRSGRKVKIPDKFQDMEMVDPVTGRRMISTGGSAPPANSLPSTPKVRPVYTGKKRGRPPRNPMAGTIPQNGSGRLSADSGHSYLEHEQPSPSEEDSLDAAFHTNNNTTDIGQSNGGDHSALRLAAINPDTSNLQPFSADGTPLKLPMYEGLSAVRHGGDTGSTLALKAARTMSSPLKPAVTVGNNGLTSRAAKRPRKKTLSPEDGGTAVKRKRLPSLKNFDGQVNVPPGLLEAMRKKRQVTAYLVFCRSERPSVMRDMPEGDFSQFSKELGNRWNALPEEEKVRWRRIAHSISQTLAADGDLHSGPRRPRNIRDKIIRDLDARVTAPAGNTAFDLVGNINIMGEQLSNMSNCINVVSFTPGSQEPSGCVDAIMDSALVMIGSALGLMAQVPVLRDYVDMDTLDDLADSIGMTMPLVHLK